MHCLKSILSVKFSLWKRLISDFALPSKRKDKKVYHGVQVVHYCFTLALFTHVILKFISNNTSYLVLFTFRR